MLNIFYDVAISGEKCTFSWVQRIQQLFEVCSIKEWRCQAEAMCDVMGEESSSWVKIQVRGIRRNRLMVKRPIGEQIGSRDQGTRPQLRAE